MRVHAYFAFVRMVLAAAFRPHKTKGDEFERRGQETRISRYRRKLEMLNRDRLVVLCGDDLGISRSWEFTLLIGVTVRERAVMGETAQTVLRRYGVERPEP